jgi:hypothetical protein
MIHHLDGKSYEATAQLHGLKKYPWGYSRAFTVGQDIFINEDAFYLDERDKLLLLRHEWRHTDAPPHDLTALEKVIGADHTIFGVMCPWGLVRWLTASR